MKNYYETKEKDIQLCKNDPHYRDVEPLKKCSCGGRPTIDVSMALIHCNKCGLCFEYRYARGVVPYHTWQLSHSRGT